jgi:hypothetical protein
MRVQTFGASRSAPSTGLTCADHQPSNIRKDPTRQRSCAIMSCCARLIRGRYAAEQTPRLMTELRGNAMTNAMLMLLPLALGLELQTPATTTAHIEARSGEPVLVLTAPMEAALRAFDTQFTVRRLSDYPPFMWRPECTSSPECARGLYRLNPREAPFAVVGDFNGDGILDAVMDGDNLRRGRRIVLLSHRQSFSANEVDSPGRIPDDIESSRSNRGASRDWEHGIDVGLSWAKPDTYRTPHESQTLVLQTDGFVVSYFEKASVLYYLRNGKWNKFTLSD